MKFLVDAQLPPAVAIWLREAGHEAWAVRELGLRDAEDGVIWNHALDAGMAILTKDEDFPMRAQRSVSAPIIVWLRVGNSSNQALKGWFMPQLPQIAALVDQGYRVLEIR